MKKICLTLSAILAVTLPATAAQAGDVSISTTLDYTTDYVFRGVSLADSAVQPGVEAAIGDFSFGAWFSTGVGDTSIFAGDEVDLYASYGFTLSDKVSASVGATYYHYPQGGSLFETKNGAAGTYEVSAGVAFDALLAPSATVYYDFTLEAFTLEGGLSHSLPVGEKSSFDLGLTAGLVDGDGFSYEYAQASAALSYAFTDDVSTYVGANYALSSDNTLNYGKILAGNPKDNLLFFGAGVSAGF